MAQKLKKHNKVTIEGCSIAYKIFMELVFKHKLNRGRAIAGLFGFNRQQSCVLLSGIVHKKLYGEYIKCTAIIISKYRK